MVGYHNNSHASKTLKGNIMFFKTNYLTKTIEGTKSAFDRAGKSSGKTHEELERLLKLHPDFQCVTVKPEIKSGKKTYKGLNIKFMERFIKAQMRRDEFMAEFERVNAYAKATQEVAFPFIKKWFLDKFSTEDEKFDMEKAREIISAYEQAEAAKYTASESEAAAA